MPKLALFLILTTLGFAKTAWGEVELRNSTFTSELSTVPAGTMVTVNAVLKNTGDKPSIGANLRIKFPQNGFFVKIDELPDLQRNDNEREVTARLDIPAHDEYRFSFVLLASRVEARQLLSSHIEVRDFQADARLDSEFSITISSAPSTAGVVIGGLRFHPAAGWVLGWMVCYALMFVGVCARLRWVQEHPNSNKLPASILLTAPIGSASFGIVSIIMVPLAFLMVFGGMAWNDLQTLTSWKEARATILDRREVVRTTSSTRNSTTRTSTTRTPEFALKYQAGDREIISSGFGNGSTLYVGGEVMGKAEMHNWIAGNTIPCWYDPADHSNVVVRRGFGGAYIFALLPLPILWFGFRQLRKVSRAVQQTCGA